jgi:hypothetical protein
MIEHFDGIGKQFENTSFERSAMYLLQNGYSFDYISDKQIGNLLVVDSELKTEAGGRYQTIVIPSCQFIPLKTFQKLIQLGEEGATIIFPDGLPKGFSGYANFDKNKIQFQDLIDKVIHPIMKKGKTNGGFILMDDSLSILLSQSEVRKESLQELGISFIRKKEVSGRTIYMIANQKDELFEGWLPLDSKSKFAVLYDPMTGKFGKASTRVAPNGNLKISVRLTTKQTLLIETYDQEPKVNSFNNYSLTETKIPLTGAWEVTFMEGGPTLPAPINTDALSSWTDFGGTEYQNFSGTASYKMNFKKPESGEWVLDLGAVKESAEVFLNGKAIGTLIGPVYQIHLNNSDFKDDNVLEIQVSNLMANRIADLDKRNVFWKKFYNVNFPARKSENRKNGLFDASGWEPRESGLIGPVTLVKAAIN